jgi:NodT family efflux transporter outer membrane factor (OMF) lipoprotein
MAVINCGETSFLTLCLATILLGSMLSGCAKVGPDYTTPAVDLPTTWHSAIEQGLTNEVHDPRLLAHWWVVLQDPLLNGFIDRAIAANLDLEQARARLLQERAKREISGAGLLPTLDLSGSGTNIRSSGNRGSSSDANLFSLGFDANWELDLFGGVRRSQEAAEADLEAGREELRDVLVSLIAEVAQNYIEIRTYQTRLQLARENLGAQQETFELTNARYQSGLTTELAVQQAKYLVASTKAQIPNLQSALAQAEHQLAVLLGTFPGSLEEQLAPPAPIGNLPDSVAVTIPAETVRHRPDVRQAERQLAAQTARIGAATADLYPSLQLKGSIGLDSLEAGKLFNIGSRISSFGPRVSLPIFAGGAIRANIRLQSALQQESLAKYKLTVLTALQEVEDALCAYVREQERNNALVESVLAAREASNLAQSQFQAGLISFSEVLDAERSLLAYEDQLAQSKGTMFANLVRLYKALGGGWTAVTAEIATTDKE